jgi:hypothetical protein
MRKSHTVLFCLLLGILAIPAFAQESATRAKASVSPEDLRAVKSSHAYAEILVRDTELKAELDSLLVDYTDEFPKIKEIRMELELLRSEMDRLLAIKAGDAYKLSSGLGRLILAKIGHQTKLRQLRGQYSDDHPAVRRQRKTVEIYEAAIKEILS